MTRDAVVSVQALTKRYGELVAVDELTFSLKAGKVELPAGIEQRGQRYRVRVVVNGWETEEDHKAFGQRMGPHLQAVGMGRPDNYERLRIARLGWDPVPAEAS